MSAPWCVRTRQDRGGSGLPGGLCAPPYPRSSTVNGHRAPSREPAATGGTAGTPGTRQDPPDAENRVPMADTVCPRAPDPPSSSDPPQKMAGRAPGRDGTEAAGPRAASGTPGTAAPDSGGDGRLSCPRPKAASAGATTTDLLEAGRTLLAAAY